MEFRHRRIEPARKFLEMRGGYGGKEMMLGVEEHRVRNEVQPPSALCPSWFTNVAAVMHSPNRKKPCETFPSQHRPNMPSKRIATCKPKRQCDG